MKKGFIKICSLLVLTAFIFSGISVFADNSNNNNNGSKHSVKTSRNFDILKEYIRDGEITSITKNTLKIGEKENKAIFRITSETKITACDDSALEITDLKEGMQVEVYYQKTSNGKSDKSNIAKLIKVKNSEKEKVSITNALIEEISTEADHSKKLTVYYETVDVKNAYVENIINLIVDDDTEIINQFGVEVGKSVLKTGMTIDFQYDVLTATSYIEESHAYKINIVKEHEDSEIMKTQILDVYSKNNVEYILVEDNDNTDEQLTLVLSANTKIKDVNGEDIEFSKLSVGDIVNVEYSIYTTKNTPTKILVHSVQLIENKDVLKLENAKIEGINRLSDKILVSYEKEYDKKLYKKELILSINENTIIKSSKNTLISIDDLKTGMIINALYLPDETESNISIAIAYRINVAKENDDNNDDENDNIYGIYDLLDRLFVELGIYNWESYFDDIDFDDIDDDIDFEDIIKDIFEKSFEKDND